VTGAGPAWSGPWCAPCCCAWSSQPCSGTATAAGCTTRPPGRSSCGA